MKLSIDKVTTYQGMVTKPVIGFELMHMIQKGQLLQTGELTLSPAEQFYSLAA